MARLTTQSYFKISLIILLGLLLVAGAGLGACSIKGFTLGGGSLSQIGSAEVDVSGVESIDLDWAAGSVEIKAYDGDKIVLTESTTGSLAKAQEMRWEVKGSTLEIDYGRNWSCMSFGEKHLEILIPVTMAKDMNILDIDGASGDYVVSDLVCNEVKVGLASGSLNAKDMAVGDLRIDAASGNARFEGEIVGKINIDVASGHVDVVCLETPPSAVDADMASGTVSVSLPENDGFTARIEKLSGNFQCDFDTQQNGDSYLYGNGGIPIRADMASGQFLLRKTA